LAEHNGSGNGTADDAFAAAQADQSSFDGFAAIQPAPAGEHPELVVGLAFVGGVLLAGLMSRLGR
jgi:hypothetical protein